MIFHILYEDETLLVIDKPAGIPVLSDGWVKDSPSLFKTISDEFGKVFLVHRLDKQTSGVLVFTKKHDAQRKLGIQFENREVQKTYLAILAGKIPWVEMTCTLALRVNAGHNHRTIVDKINGKPAETNFFVKEKFPRYTLVEVKPKSGRTHQIRAHALALGYPLVGDSLYHAPKDAFITRTALHAKELILNHPDTGNPLTLISPTPLDFLEMLAKIRR